MSFYNNINQVQKSPQYPCGRTSPQYRQENIGGGINLIYLNEDCFILENVTPKNIRIMYNKFSSELISGKRMIMPNYFFNNKRCFLSIPAKTWKTMDWCAGMAKWWDSGEQGKEIADTSDKINIINTGYEALWSPIDKAFIERAKKIKTGTLKDSIFLFYGFIKTKILTEILALNPVVAAAAGGLYIASISCRIIFNFESIIDFIKNAPEEELFMQMGSFAGAASTGKSIRKSLAGKKISFTKKGLIIENITDDMLNNAWVKAGVRKINEKLIRDFKRANLDKKLKMAFQTFRNRNFSLSSKMYSDIVNMILKNPQKYYKIADILESHNAAVKAAREKHIDNISIEKFAEELDNRVNSVKKTVEQHLGLYAETYHAKLRLEAEKLKLTNRNISEAFKLKSANVARKIELADTAYIIFEQYLLASGFYKDILINHLLKIKKPVRFLPGIAEIYYRLWCSTQNVKAEGNLNNITIARQNLENVNNAVWRTNDAHFKDILKQLLKSKYKIPHADIQF